MMTWLLVQTSTSRRHFLEGVRWSAIYVVIATAPWRPAMSAIDSRRFENLNAHPVCPLSDPPFGALWVRTQTSMSENGSCDCDDKNNTMRHIHHMWITYKNINYRAKLCPIRQMGGFRKTARVEVRGHRFMIFLLHMFDVGGSLFVDGSFFQNLFSVLCDTFEKNQIAPRTAEIHSTGSKRRSTVNPFHK